jgi:hypothetical protein
MQSIFGRRDTTKQVSGLPAFAAGAMLAFAAPIVMVRAYGAGWNAIRAGAGTWLIGVAVKRPLVRVACAGECGRFSSAMCRGLVSGLAELGSAAPYMLSRHGPRSASAAAAMGVGAGSVEIAALIVYGAAREARNPNLAARDAWQGAARESAVVRNMFFIERAAALLTHVGSRGLLYLALRRQRAAFGIAALGVFVAVDGVAAYGKSAGWDWFAPRVASRFFGWTYAVAGAATAAVAMCRSDA